MNILENWIVDPCFIGMQNLIERIQSLALLHSWRNLIQEYDLFLWKISPVLWVNMLDIVYLGGDERSVGIHSAPSPVFLPCHLTFQRGIRKNHEELQIYIPYEPILRTTIAC